MRSEISMRWMAHKSKRSGKIDAIRKIESITSESIAALASTGEIESIARCLGRSYRSKRSVHVPRQTSQQICHVALVRMRMCGHVEAIVQCNCSYPAPELAKMSGQPGPSYTAGSDQPDTREWQRIQEQGVRACSVYPVYMYWCVSSRKSATSKYMNIASV